MKRKYGLIKCWRDGLRYLITGGSISYYIFFTMIIAGGAFLWIKPTSKTIPFTVILLGYILNVIVSAYFKGYWEGTKKERVVSIVYTALFIGLFILGCCLDAIDSLNLTIIPLVTTAYFILIMDQPFWNILKKIEFVLPFMFLILIVIISTFTLIQKVIILFFYFLFVPFISFVENYTACNIFELAYNITWDGELEQQNKD